MTESSGNFDFKETLNDVRKKRATETESKPKNLLDEDQFFTDMTMILKDNGQQKVDLDFIRSGSAHPGFSTASKRRVAQSFLIETPQKDTNRMYPNTTNKKLEFTNSARIRNPRLRQSVTKTMILDGNMNSMGRESALLLALSNEKPSRENTNIKNKISHPQFMDLDH